MQMVDALARVPTAVDDSTVAIRQFQLLGDFPGDNKQVAHDLVVRIRQVSQ